MSQELTNNLILLAATAAVSGFLVPFILTTVEQRRTRELKEREATLARQANLVAAQATFLDDLAEAVWAWRYTAVRVTYYGAEGDDVQYQEAKDQYGRDLWAELNSIRLLTSKSRRLAGDVLYHELLDFYDCTVEFDRQILQVTQEPEPRKRRLKFLDINVELLQQVSAHIDNLLTKLADHFQLSYDPSSPVGTMSEPGGGRKWRSR